jgi:hypothetical protein
VIFPEFLQDGDNAGRTILTSAPRFEGHPLRHLAHAAPAHRRPGPWPSNTQSLALSAIWRYVARCHQRLSDIHRSTGYCQLISSHGPTGALTLVVSKLHSDIHSSMAFLELPSLPINRYSNFPSTPSIKPQNLVFSLNAFSSLPKRWTYSPMSSNISPISRLDPPGFDVGDRRSTKIRRREMDESTNVVKGSETFTPEADREFASNLYIPSAKNRTHGYSKTHFVI